MKRHGLATVLLLLFCLKTAAVPRVALMDFSTDDNSYRSARVAADFTSILQAELAGDADVEWVERTQLDKARQELELSVAELVGGGSAIRHGKWVKADWMVIGQFSLDDKNQRILFLEITDLRHADTLASRTITFTGVASPQFKTDTNHVGIAAAALRHLLAEAQIRERQAAGKIRVAALFLANTGSDAPFPQDPLPIERVFNEALERAVATNARVQLTRFPKAYRSIGESEMVLDGLISTDHNQWQQTADIYVWGTWSIEPQRIPGRLPERKREITLHVWDGATPPVVLKEQLPDNLQSQQMQTILERMADQVIAGAHRSATPVDPGALRISIAQSLVATYDQMSPDNGRRRSIDFLEAAHMLETACFFDPDNAKARLLYMSLRWGFWIEFSQNVKTPFWSKWRRSQAWGNYVNRFGLKPVDVKLPFPYQQRGGIPAAYVETLKDALKAFPQWHSTEEVALEDPYRQQGVHTWLLEAELHGFPKEMPHELSWQWKQEVTAELARREKKVEEFLKSATATGNRPGLPGTQMPTTAPTGENAMTKTIPAKPTPRPSDEQSRRQIVPTPAWLKSIPGNSPLFQLSPPNALPDGLKPVFAEIKFPEHYEVKSVLQLGRWQDKMLILTMDERSAPSSEINAEISSELRSERNRIWMLDGGATQPVLYKPELLPGRMHAFLQQDDRLWIAGNPAGYLDLSTSLFHQYGLGEGLPLQETVGIGSAAGTVITCSDSFKAFQLDSASDHWSELPRQTGKYSWSGGNPFILTSNSRWLNFAQKDTAVFVYDLVAKEWQNLSERCSIQCSAATGNGFWFGCRDGLKFYDPAGKTLKEWPTPVAIPGIRNLLTGFGYMGNSTMMRGDLEMQDQQIQGAVRRAQQEHGRTRKDRLDGKKPIDPFHLNWRMPGDVSALCVEGDYLWMGSGYNVLLVHVPSESIVANYPLPTRDGVASLLLDSTSVWIGTAYGDHKLIRLSKEAFTSVPQARWVSLAISPVERERFIKGMSVRNRAVYAFSSGEDEQVVQLLAGINPQKASLEEMFLLLFSCEANGTDKPDLMKFWAERIQERWPDSPWARVAQAVVVDNESKHKARQHESALLAAYDLNQDGVLSAQEKSAMEKDPAYQQDQKTWQSEQLEEQIKDIMKKFDRNADGRLDADELAILCAQVTLYSDAPPEMLAGRKVLISPLLSKRFPSAAVLLKQYDAGNIGGLDAAALKSLANTLSKKP